MKSILISAALLGCGLSQINNQGFQFAQLSKINPSDLKNHINLEIPINTSPTMPTINIPACKDIIINGDFSDNKCNSSYCQYDAKSYNNQVNGWLPSPTMQIGWGYLYNKEISNQKKDNRVMELDVQGNSCIKQKLNLIPGRYELEYDWAAKVGLSLETSKMSVYLNNKVIQSHTPPDYHLQHVKYPFTVDKFNQIDLTFCAQGTSDVWGAVIDNVHMFSMNLCPFK